MTPEVRAELQQLLSALCDGVLTEAEQARLEQLLDADAECRQHYLEYVDLHAQLLIHHGLGGVRLPSSLVREPADSAPATLLLGTHRPPQRKGSQFLRYLLVATATLAASVLVQVGWGLAFRDDSERVARPTSDRVETAPPAYIATLTQAADCKWGNAHEPRRVGSRLAPGDLKLQQGIARIHFDSGSDILLEGPAHLRLETTTSALVLRGKIVFRADETASAFDLHTPLSTLLDLGTEYAVVVGPEGEEIHVFDGEVQRMPKAARAVDPEHLLAGQARRYGTSPVAAGQPTELDPDRFIRRVVERAAPAPDLAAGLLAYEGFDYPDATALQRGTAHGGSGWLGPWTPGFARPLLEGDRNDLALNVKEGLSRPGSTVPSIGGSFDYLGFAKYWRRLATPVRLDTEGVYYLSFLFRRQGPPADELNALAVLLRTSEELQNEDPRKRLNVGVGGVNQLFTHLQKIGCRTPLPLSYGETYLLVAKIVASGVNADQVFLRVYGPEEPVEPTEPGTWSVAGPPFQSDLVFDWLEVHINSKTRQTMDEIRLGTTWSSVTAPWIVRPADK
jgi:ferric-dicitrate binding protein FerR (iron transport regulator)